jgi:hypothetical protein
VFTIRVEQLGKEMFWPSRIFVSRQGGIRVEKIMGYFLAASNIYGRAIRVGPPQDIKLQACLMFVEATI